MHKDIKTFWLQHLLKDKYSWHLSYQISWLNHLLIEISRHANHNKQLIKCKLPYMEKYMYVSQVHPWALCILLIDFCHFYNHTTHMCYQYNLQSSIRLILLKQTMVEWKQNLDLYILNTIKSVIWNVVSIFTQTETLTSSSLCWEQ